MKLILNFLGIGRNLEEHSETTKKTDYIGLEAVGFEERSDDKLLPKRETHGAAGIDLKAATSLTIKKGETVLVPTGYKWEIPYGYVGMVCSRSGLALKKSVFVLNAPGIIDSDFRGEVGVILHNAGKKPFEIVAGDRIAQMVVTRVEKLPLLRVTKLSETTRGCAGFGSTGVK